MPSDQTFCPAPRRKFVLFSAILASAMGFIDGSVVSIAIPAIRTDLSASLVEVQWINNAYMLALSALILVGGAAGDQFGVVRVFIWGIGLFVAASLLCAIAPAADSLILARGLQGIGAAIMVPGSLALISKSYPRAERGKAIGIWAAASAITTAAGPIIGGILLSIGDASIWRVIFFINLPLGALCLWMLITRVPRDTPRAAGRLDWPGAILATLALGAVAWGFTGAGGEHGGGATFAHIALWAGGGLAILLAFIWWEIRALHPMMPLHLFAMPGFGAANLVTFAVYFALAATMFYVPMILIAVWEIPEWQVTLLFVPLTLFIAPLSGPVGALADRIGTAPPIGLGCLCVACAYASLALGLDWMQFWGHVLPSMGLMGFGMALIVAPLSAAVMGAVEDQDSGAASGVNNAISRVAGLIAVAAMGGVGATLFVNAGGTQGAFGEAGANLAASNAGLAGIVWVTAALSAIAAAIALTRLRWGPAAP